MTLTEFVTARLDERAEKAQAAMNDGEGRWTQVDAAHYPGLIADERGEIVVYDEGSPTEEQAAHIAENDPASILRDVEAQRRRIELHSAEPGQHPDFCGHDLHELPCPTLRLEALPYDGHPDYREKWRV